MVEFLTSKAPIQARAAGQVSRAESQQLKQAGQVAQQTANNFSEFFEKEAAIENERLLAEGQAQWARTYNERAKDAGNGFAKGISGEYKEYVAQVMENSPERGRDRLKLALDKYGLTLETKALGRESAVRAAGKVKAVAQARRDRGVALFHDPTLLSEYAAKDPKNADFYTNVANSVLIKEDPEQVLQNVLDGKFDKSLSAKQLLATKKNAEQEIARVAREAKTAQAVAVKNFSVAASEEVAYAQANGAPPVDSLMEGPEFEALQSTNPEEAAKLKEEYDLAISEAEVIHGVNTSSAEELQLSFDEAQSAVKDPGRSVKDSRHLSTLAKAIKDRNTAIADDSASFVLGTSDEVSQTFAAYQGADAEDRDIAARNYVSGLDEQYNRLGVPNNLRRVLPENMADAIVENFNKMGADIVTSSLKAFKDEWGDAAPQVIAELSKAELPSEFAASMRHSENPGLAASIVGLKGVKEIDLTKDLPSLEVSDARKEIIDSLASYRSAFEIGDTTGAAARTFSNNSGIATRLVFSEMRKGVEKSTAVRTVLEQMFPEDIIEADNMNLIVPVGIDSDDLQLGLEIASREDDIRAFNPAPLDDPRLPEFADKEVMIQSAVDNGIWLNNSTGDGAVLHLNIGGYFLAVENAAGEPYEVKFDAVESSSGLEQLLGIRFGSSGQEGVRQTNSEKTNETTPQGRPVFRDLTTGEVFSEKTETITAEDGRVFNVPTVLADGNVIDTSTKSGRKLLFDTFEGNGFVDPITGEKLKPFETISEAVRAAKKRSGTRSKQ